MKKYMLMTAIIALICASMVGCIGPNEQEEAALKKTEDSLMDIDRNQSVDDADRMLREADSLEQVRLDSIEKASQK